MKKRIILGIGILLALLSLGAFATNARIVWTPQKFNPWSIAPGESISATVSFTNIGPSTINARKLEPRLEGNETFKRLVSVGSVSLPKVVKRGGSVSIPLTLFASSSEPMGVVRGQLVLQDIHPNGSVRETFRDTLPIEITVSTIPLPPDPGEAGKETVEGIITNPYKIRDDILRHIVFAFPNPTDEPKRNAFIQYAQADQKMAEDYLALANDPVERKRVVREDDDKRGRGQFCMSHVFGKNEPSLTYDEYLAISRAVDGARHALDLAFQNTNERIRIYDKTDALLGGMVTKIPNIDEYPGMCDQDPLD